MNDLETFVRRLATEGGKIVSSNDCSVADIAVARACDRFFVLDDGLGFVFFPKADSSTV